MQENHNTKINIIAAIGAENRVIGTSDGNIPWHISEDFKYFKEKTSGHPMIMGRKTFETLDGRILPDRPHILVTSQADYLDKAYIRPEHLERKSQLFIATDFKQALELSQELAQKMETDQIFIAGGGRTYNETIDIADRLYLTIICKKDGTPIDGSVFFPEYELKFQTEISRETHSNENYDFDFVVLEK